MVDLVRWLRAQLDEDERTARAADAGPWQGKHLGRHDQAAVNTGARGGLIQLDGPRAAANGTHIVVHDPARVLREIDAKRAMVDAYAEADAMSRATAENYGAWVNSEPLPHPEEAEGKAEVKDRLKGLHYALRLLALPYADRPGYREDWRP